jgi:hypothetical protein
VNHEPINKAGRRLASARLALDAALEHVQRHGWLISAAVPDTAHSPRCYERIFATCWQEY